MPAGVRPHSPAVTTPGGSAAPTRPGETDPAYNDVVLSFLRKRGYQKAEEALRQDIEAAKLKAAAAAAGNTSGATAAGATPGVAGAGPGAGANAGAATAAGGPGGAAGGQSTASGGSSTAAGGPGGGAAGAKPTTGGPQAATHGSHTVPLSTLVQRNAPRLTKQQAAVATNSPIYDLLLQQLPSSALHGLGLADVAREKERREHQEKIAGAVAAGPAGVKKDNVADVEIKLLDPQERVLGYEGVREWVESGLEAWKVRACQAVLLTGIAPDAKTDLSRHRTSFGRCFSQSLSTRTSPFFRRPFRFSRDPSTSPMRRPITRCTLRRCRRWLGSRRPPTLPRAPSRAASGRRNTLCA